MITASSRDAVDTSPVREAHSEIPTRKTDAWGTHQNAARTSARHLKQAYIYFIAKVKPFGVVTAKAVRGRKLVGSRRNRRNIDRRSDDR